jgi:hypothetical protein
MSHGSDFTVLDGLIRARGKQGRWLYLVASLFPAVTVSSYLANPYPLHGYGMWLVAALLAVCAGQVFRPCILGGSLVACTYAWLALGAIEREIGAFEDIGSEDHSRWEGWGLEAGFLAYTAFLVLLSAAAAVHVRKMAVNAT